MKKQGLCKTGHFLKGRGKYMNRIGKMGIRFQEKILFKKKLDYQETYFIRKKNINYSSIQREIISRKEFLI